MQIVKLTDTVAVAAQITPANVADIAAAGYRVLVNNRPDGEEANQPSSADIAAAAQALGLEYHHMPVTAMNFPGPDFDCMSRLLDDPERPVLAFCRTGTRCANLWVASHVGESRQQAVVLARQLGYDLGLVTRIS